jgi:hypothetical protein
MERINVLLEDDCRAVAGFESDGKQGLARFWA